MARDSRQRKRDAGLKSEVPSLALYGAGNIDTVLSPINAEQPKRMSFTELADELTRRSNLDA